MKKLIIISAIALCFLFYIGSTAYASEEEGYKDCTSPPATSTNGKNVSHLHEHCYTRTKDTIHHDHLKDPKGVGADVLLVETEKVDLVAEYKYDFENEQHSVFGVFKTKTALWDIIKGFFNKGE